MSFRILFALCTATILLGQSKPGPLTIDAAVEEALTSNLDLAAERWNITVAEAREITARLRPNPVLTVSGQTLNLLGARYNSNTPLGPNQLNIHTDLPIERGQKRLQRVAVAQADRSLAESGVRELMRQVIYAVSSAFVDVQQGKENLKLAEENLRSLQGVVDINEARLRSGDLAQVELDRSRLAVLQSRTSVQQAQLNLQQAKTQLQLLIGRKPASPDFDITGDLRREESSRSQIELTQLALRTRPDLQNLQQNQARSQADLRLQLANGKVDFSIGTEYTHQRAWGIGGSSIGVYVSTPLPFFNRNQGEIARAQRTISQATARSLALQSGIEAEVEKAYRQYAVSQRVLASIEGEMLSRARSVRETTEYSYRRGEASLLEFLDAQRAFNEAMQTYNDARGNFARSLYLIDAVAGISVLNK